MKIENLQENMVIKNYKELCSLLEIKSLAGNSKKGTIKRTRNIYKLWETRK